jgi:EpsI family protein
MEIKRVNFWMVVIVLALSAIFVFSVYKKEQRIEKGEFVPFKVPESIAGWRGEKIELSEDITDILGTKKIILRQYEKDKDLIWLYLVHSEKNRTSFHPPEYCYLGGGDYELISKEVISIPYKNDEFTLNKLIFKTSKRRQMVLFWYASGNKSFASYYKQQLNLVFNALKGKSTEGIMVRLSSYIYDNEQETLDKLKIFLRELLPYISG